MGFSIILLPPFHQSEALGPDRARPGQVTVGSAVSNGPLQHLEAADELDAVRLAAAKSADH
jgi:hypothetical protein